MSERTPQQIGRSNRRTGYAWQEACAAWLRRNGWPHAEYVNRKGASDIAGTGDVAVEATTTTWDKIWIKLAQSARDGAARGLDTPIVWKKQNGKTDPGEGVVLMPAKLFWADRADLEAYRRREMDMQDQFERGYELGRKEREAMA